MSHELTRRDFVTVAGALAGAALLPAAAAAARRSPAEGTVVLFQGDSITDGGRNRAASEPNQPGALGTSYPLLVAAAALAAHPDRALRFYNRGVSGNKVPDLEQRWAADTLELKGELERQGYVTRLISPGEATSESIRNALASARQLLDGKPQSTFLFVFSGHGFQTNPGSTDWGNTFDSDYYPTGAVTYPMVGSTFHSISGVVSARHGGEMMPVRTKDFVP